MVEEMHGMSRLEQMNLHDGICTGVSGQMEYAARSTNQRVSIFTIHHISTLASASHAPRGLRTTTAPLHQPSKKTRQRLILRLTLLFPLRRRRPALLRRPDIFRRGRLFQPPHHVIRVNLYAAHVELHRADVVVDAGLMGGLFLVEKGGVCGGEGIAVLGLCGFFFFGFEAVEDGELGGEEGLGAEGGYFEGLARRSNGVGSGGFGVRNCVFVSVEDGDGAIFRSYRGVASGLLEFDVGAPTAADAFDVKTFA